jgi:hypothetical protein
MVPRGQERTSRELLYASSLLQERWQVGSVLRREKVTTPGEQATDMYRMLGYFVAPHGAIALFNPPANGALTGIVGPIKCFSCGSFPRAVARQAVPQVPAIQKQES